jgi:hypothetical protein
VSTGWAGSAGAALTHELIDDAALFPPARTPLPEAVRAFRERRDTARARLVGPLVVRASQVPELRQEFGPSDHFCVALVADGGLAELAAAVDVLADDPWAEVVQVEITVPDGFDVAQATDALLRELPFTVPAYLELPWRAPSGQVAEALEVLRADGVERAKLRTGGLEPGSVPSSRVLSEFLHTAATHGVPFKLTAGLHHALPNVERATGDRQHGFLNALSATAASLGGGSVDDACDLLEVTDAVPLLSVLEASDSIALRQMFRSIGSCSVDEPFDELVSLQLLEDG